jgi:acyloxyacyl hydrolase
LLGNDVCSPHAGENPMTKPDVFEKNIRSILDQLDAKLPSNSHVFALAGMDGELMYDKMHNRMHPNINTTYGHIWEYISCLGSNACWGWLNRNETWRKFTTQRARELADVFPKIAQDQKWKSFKFDYLGSTMGRNMAWWESQGGDPKYMFQAIDGGHPGQLHQALKAKNLYELIEQKYPQAIGQVNPHNAEIDRLFKDQGGH